MAKDMGARTRKDSQQTLTLSAKDKLALAAIKRDMWRWKGGGMGAPLPYWPHHTFH